jgi:carbon storage regulator
VLVLTRKMGEGIVLGENVHVKVLRISGSRVTIGIEAPPSVRVLRADLQQEPSRAAAHDEPATPEGLDGAALVR